MGYGLGRVLPIALLAATPWFVQAEEGMTPHGMSGPNAAPTLPVEDTRPLVHLKPETVSLLRADMRGMLAAFSNVLSLVGDGKKKEAAAILENDLGMSAMKNHPGMMKASQELPENVRMLGMEMHKAASRLAKNIDSMNPSAIDRGLGEVSAGCVSCHMAYRVR